MIVENPLFGRGAPGVAADYMYYQAEYFRNNPESGFVKISNNHYQSYNIFVQMLVEHGVVGHIGNNTTSPLCPCLSPFPFWVWGLGIARRSLFSPRSTLLHLTCSLPLSPIIVCPPWLGACDR